MATSARRSSIPVAEAVAIRGDASIVATLFEGRPLTWLRPFLVVAWNEAERATTGSSTPTHQVRLGPPVGAPSGTTSFELRWTVTGARAVFSGVRGHLLVERVGGTSILSFHGGYTPVGVEAGGSVAVTPAEMAVRGLLGQLRNAIEQR